MLDRSYLEVLADLLPGAGLIDLAPSVRISYVGAAPTGSLLTLTAGLKLQLTHHYADAEVAPGRLDVVVVPGPNPREEWEDGALAWLRAQAEGGDGAAAPADVLSVCSGVYVCGAAGLLAPGTKVCGPRSLQGDLRERFGAAEWVGDERRWVRDGNFWSSGEWRAAAAHTARRGGHHPLRSDVPPRPAPPPSPFLLFPLDVHGLGLTRAREETGGVTNGNDLVAAYCRESGRFDPQLVEIALAMAEVGDRPMLYSNESQS